MPASRPCPTRVRPHAARGYRSRQGSGPGRCVTNAVRVLQDAMASEGKEIGSRTSSSLTPSTRGVCLFSRARGGAFSSCMSMRAAGLNARAPAATGANFFRRVGLYVFPGFSGSARHHPSSNTSAISCSGSRPDLPSVEAQMREILLREARGKSAKQITRAAITSTERYQRAERVDQRDHVKRQPGNIYVWKSLDPIYQKHHE